MKFVDLFYFFLFTAAAKTKEDKADKDKDKSTEKKPADGKAKTEKSDEKTNEKSEGKATAKTGEVFRLCKPRWLSIIPQRVFIRPGNTRCSFIAFLSIRTHTQNNAQHF